MAVETEQITPTIYKFMYRVLRELYSKPQFVFELETSAELNNPADAVKKLRDLGFNIINEWLPSPKSTPNHHRRHIVKYHLHPESRPLALETLYKHRHTT